MILSILLIYFYLSKLSFCRFFSATHLHKLHSLKFTLFSNCEMPLSVLDLNPTITTC